MQKAPASLRRRAAQPGRGPVARAAHGALLGLAEGHCYYWIISDVQLPKTEAPVGIPTTRYYDADNFPRTVPREIQAHTQVRDSITIVALRLHPKFRQQAWYAASPAFDPPRLSLISSPSSIALLMLFQGL